MSTPPLPLLTANPIRHHACCASLSTTLLETLQTILNHCPPVPVPVSKSNPSPSPAPVASASGPSPTPSGPILLSIGSGTGLLEALLQAHLLSPSPSSSTSSSSQPSPPSPNTPSSHPEWKIHGIEVPQTQNIYLPPSHLHRVPGTWALTPLASTANALLFVYPRSGALVKRYINKYFDTGVVQIVLWIGPKADWGDTGFGRGEGEIVEGVGLVEYEMLAFLRRG